MSVPQPPTLEPTFPGTGEMATLMRAFDWAHTPLGSPATWPLSLRTVVRVMLTSRYAMWMGWGPGLTFLYNDAYGRMTLGSKHPWALGRPSQEVWAEIWPQIGPRIESVLHTGQATWDEALLLFLERSGYPEETYHTFSYSPLTDDEGLTQGHLCVVTEETERVIGERRLALLRDVAAAIARTNTEQELLSAIEGTLAQHGRDLPFSSIYLTERGSTRVTRAAGAVLIEPAGASGASFDYADSGAIWPTAAAVESGGAILNLDARFGSVPHGPWDRPPAQAIVVPIAQQGQVQPTGFFIAGLNPFRRVDAAYRTFIDLLVGQIAAGIANARAYEAERQRAAALAEIDRAKTIFFSNVSHEFRTPLTLLLGPLEEALNSPARALSGPELDTSYRNAVRLLKLVNALLDFARIEAGRVEANFVPTALDQFTTEIVSVFRSAFERAELTLSIECDTLTEPVFVDRDLFEKVLLNLLSNALKFTFEGGVTVRLRQHPDCVELSVHDSGVGVPPAQLPRLFERFHRVEGMRARTHEGSGIGLALVQELVRLHGGSITADSAPSQGTTFTVTLKRGTAHLPADRVFPEPSMPGTAFARTAFVEEALHWLPGEDDVAPADPGLDTKGVRVLVADDNADMRRYVARLLSASFQVHAVTNGREALAALGRQPADLVIADVMMPELDGFALLREMKTRAALRHIPVILLSARSGEDARIQGIESGADDYLTKPFSARELVARVRSQIALTHARRQVAAERDRLRTLLSRLEEQTIALALARHEAEDASRAKDEFLAMLGHELRNPLAPIVTTLQLMRLRGALSPEHGVIERQVGHLTRLVDDLLDVSRITRGKIELDTQPLETSEIIDRAMEIAAPLLDQRSHDVRIDVPRHGLGVNADIDRLAQVVANILTNAAKYSDQGSRIWVRAANEGDHVEIRVRDEGMGIAREMLSRIFEPFIQQPQSLDRSRGGLGLGLAIVRNLTQLHNGTVCAESDGPGHGSEFILKLPHIDLGHSSTPRTIASWVESPAPEGALRVLVVDDNHDAATALRLALETTGFIVDVAHDAEAALSRVGAFRPAVALLDIGLPTMDGYELAVQIRAREDGDAMRLIALSGYGQDADKARSAEAGFEEHLVKPVDLDYLVAVLHQRS